MFKNRGDFLAVMCSLKESVLLDLYSCNKFTYPEENIRSIYRSNLFPKEQFYLEIANLFEKIDDFEAVKKIIFSEIIGV